MMASFRKSTADTDECGKLFADPKHPTTPDMEAFAPATGLNLETLTATRRIIAECARTIARRHMEIVQQSMAEVTGAVRTMSSLEPPQATDINQVELLKRAYSEVPPARRSRAT